MRQKLCKVLVLAVIVACQVGGSSTLAATPPKGISISPFQQQITMAGTGSDQSFELSLANNTGALQEIKLSSRDFGSLNDTGGVLLEGSKDYDQKYGLVSWLSLGTDTVLLEPGESRNVPITIQNRADLQPGGHYGAVVASVNSLDDQASNRVVANQQLLSLLFVTKTGGEHYDLQLKDIASNGNWLHLPNKVTLRFQNPGNVHIIPRGIVRLKSPSGRVLAQGVINSESAILLPETFRELRVPLTSTATAVPVPGLYRIEVEYRYDGIAQSVKRHTTLNFVSLPTYLVLGLLFAAAFAYLNRHKKRRKNNAKNIVPTEE